MMTKEHSQENHESTAPISSHAEILHEMKDTVNHREPFEHQVMANAVPADGQISQAIKNTSNTVKAVQKDHKVKPQRPRKTKEKVPPLAHRSQKILTSFDFTISRPETSSISDHCTKNRESGRESVTDLPDLNTNTLASASINMKTDLASMSRENTGESDASKTTIIDAKNYAARTEVQAVRADSNVSTGEIDAKAGTAQQNKSRKRSRKIDDTAGHKSTGTVVDPGSGRNAEKVQTKPQKVHRKTARSAPSCGNVQDSEGSSQKMADTTKAVSLEGVQAMQIINPDVVDMNVTRSPKNSRKAKKSITGQDLSCKNIENSNSSTTLHSSTDVTMSAPPDRTVSEANAQPSHVEALVRQKPPSRRSLRKIKKDTETLSSPNAQSMLANHRRNESMEIIQPTEMCKENSKKDAKVSFLIPSCLQTISEGGTLPDILADELELPEDNRNTATSRSKEADYNLNHVVDVITERVAALNDSDAALVEQFDTAIFRNGSTLEYVLSVIGFFDGQNGHISFLSEAFNWIGKLILLTKHSINRKLIFENIRKDLPELISKHLRLELFQEGTRVAFDLEKQKALSNASSSNNMELG